MSGTGLYADGVAEHAEGSPADASAEREFPCAALLPQSITETLHRMARERRTTVRSILLQALELSGLLLSPCPSHGEFGLSNAEAFGEGAKDRLRTTAAHLDSVLASVPMGIVIVGLDRRIMVANARATQIFRRACGELVGATTHILYDNDEQSAAVEQRLYPILNAGGGVDEELQMRRGDGTLFWARVVGRRVSMTAPSLGIVWVVDDITERKATEQALAANFQFQRVLIDTIPVPLFVKDTQARYIDANAAFERWVGIDRHALSGKTVYDVAPPDLARTYHEADTSLLASPGTQVYETHAKSADGVERTVEFSKAVFFDASGAPAGIVGVMVDISERKRMEQALRERQELFEQIFVANLAVKLLIDPADGRIVDANPAAAEFYGYSLDTLRAMRISDINTLAPTEIQEEMERARTEKRKYFLFQHRLSSGELRDVEVYSSPIPVNQRLLLLSLIHDITERRKAEEALRRLATIDSLTGLSNRRTFLEVADAELTRGRRYRHPTAVLMVDIDYFKRINDAHGHAVGDETLRRVGGVFRDVLRQTDLVGRLGGEEFGIVLPATGVDAACNAAERLRSRIAEIEVFASTGVVRPTVSIGVTVVEDTDTSMEKALGQADAALYRAKELGRNRIERAAQAARPEFGQA